MDEAPSGGQPKDTFMAKIIYWNPQHVCYSDFVTFLIWRLTQLSLNNL